MKVVFSRNRVAHLGLLLSLSALVAEVPKYYGMKRLSAYGLAVTLVCQINSSIMSFREKVKKRREWEAAMAEKAAEVAKRSNPKKKNS
mmetsp:Transcript_32644/g.106124  ORF Transcript_32644/g.106124 Transcript_32644/m.106124 type:complete len:88 (+) Transcript_32644:132-395(+)